MLARNLLTSKLLFFGFLIASTQNIPAQAPSGEVKKADTQYIAVASNRVGPYSAMGTGYYGAQIDYMNYVNMHGGVNGVKLIWEECETEYNAAKTAECYGRLKTKDSQKTVVFDTLGTPGAYAVINNMATDNIVLAQYGYGRTDAANGEVWPWVFNAAGHYWSQISATLKFIAKKEGGIEKMKGKKIVHLHIDTAYGREPLPAMRQLANEWGYTLIEIPIPAPGLEQESQWLQIRRERPDWITFWGAGSGMNSTGMTQAARKGFPRDRMVYVTFGGAEEDMMPAGDAAKSTYVMANARPGIFPLIKKIKEEVYGAGKGNLSDPKRLGSVYYNRGLASAVMWIEALKNAQKIHKKVGKAVTGAEFRDGYEALNISPERLEEIGIGGMSAPFALSCSNHEGAEGRFTVMQWDGAKFVMVTDWEGPENPSYIRKLVVESSEKFAKENNITLKKCAH